MGIAKASIAFLAAIAAFSAGAQTQHEPSMYSLGFSVDRAPVVSTCPATLLYCGPSLGLNLVGRAQISSFGVFGKVGTLSSARPDTSVMGMAAASGADPGGAWSWGGGVSWDVTPRLSATFEWVSYDLRVPAGPVRSTSLGLRYRY